MSDQSEWPQQPGAFPPGPGQGPGYSPPGQQPYPNPGYPTPGYLSPGYPQSAYGHGGFPPKTSGLAVASLLVSIFMGWIPIAGALLAIGLGVGAVRSINGSSGAIKGKGIAVAGLVLGTLGLLFWIAVFVIAAVADPVPVDPVAGGDRPDSSDLELAGVAQPGDCFDFDLDGGEYTNDADDTVSCAVPHSAEYAGALILPNAAGEVYPGDDETFLAGLDGCADVYVDHVGEEIGLRPELDIFVAYPSELSWRILDDREVFCYVINADETDLLGPVTS